MTPESWLGVSSGKAVAAGEGRLAPAASAAAAAEEPGWIVPPRTNARGADLLSDSLASPNDCTNSSYTFAASASALCGAHSTQSGGVSAGAAECAVLCCKTHAPLRKGKQAQSPAQRGTCSWQSHVGRKMRKCNDVPRHGLVNRLARERQRTRFLSSSTSLCLCSKDSGVPRVSARAAAGGAATAQQRQHQHCSPGRASFCAGR